MSGAQEDAIRLRQLLEKLELALLTSPDDESGHSRGLGSNNLLFMACELPLLAAERDGFPLLLIEEPEAHLHPQRQSRLMSFVQEQAGKVRADGQRIQIIVTTHSPNLASDLKLENLALIEGGRGFSFSNRIDETYWCIRVRDAYVNTRSDEDQYRGAVKASLDSVEPPSREVIKALEGTLLDTDPEVDSDKFRFLAKKSSGYRHVHDYLRENPLKVADQVRRCYRDGIWSR